MRMWNTGSPGETLMSKRIRCSDKNMYGVGQEQWAGESRENRKGSEGKGRKGLGGGEN